MKHLTTFRVIDAIARSGSIRGAADILALTPSAVQRRLQSYETEIGFEIFDRRPQGVELNSAGELVLMHIRETFSETGKLTSRLADLSGMRRGEVRIGCSQAMVPYFLPRHISSYQTAYPNVTFKVVVMEHQIAQSALANHTIDLAIVFAADRVPEFRTLLGVRQQLAAVMAPNHPLAHFEQLRLRQCYEHPVALSSVAFGSRSMVNAALREKSYARRPELESNSFEYLKAHVAKTMAVTFQIESGAPLPPVQDTYLTARLIDHRDIVPGILWLGQLSGRRLSVAASRFLEQVERDLSERYQPV